MKDALGHGSNAHSSGVEQVGKTPLNQPPIMTIKSAGGTSDMINDGKPHAINDRQSYRVYPSTIPGLAYIKTRNGSSKFFTLYHQPSGKIVGDWKANGEKDKEFTAGVDARLAPLGIDWTRDAEGVARHPNYNSTLIGRALRGRTP